MSFLNQLKTQASALQTQNTVQHGQLEANMQATESAAKAVWLYVAELAKQLNIIGPDGPKVSLDGRTPWPALKLVDFRVDSRKKMLRDKEVYDYIAMGWRMVPRAGSPVPGSVSANFPPDLQRIESRLASGAVKHERVNVRHPEKNTLQAIRFDYSTEARGSLTVTADHDAAKLVFRLGCVQALDIVNTTYAAAQVTPGVLDELAKLLVGQPSSFV